MGRHLRREAAAALLLAGRPRHSGDVDRAQAQRAVARQRRMQPVHVQLRVALGLREGAAFHHPRPDPARLRRGAPGEGHRRQARGSRARGGRRRQVRDRPYGNAHPEHLPGHLQPAAHPVSRGLRHVLRLRAGRAPRARCGPPGKPQRQPGALLLPNEQGRARRAAPGARRDRGGRGDAR